MNEQFNYWLNNTPYNISYNVTYNGMEIYTSLDVQEEMKHVDAADQLVDAMETYPDALEIIKKVVDKL